MQNRGWFADTKRTLVLNDMPMPEPKEGEVLVKMAANGICGSDIHFYLDGKLGKKKIDSPLVLGHECSGTVVGFGKGGTAKGLKEGDRVVLEPGIPCGVCKLCMTGRYNICPHVRFFASPPVHGSLCDYVVLPEFLVFPIPDKLSLEAASLAEPAAVGIQAVKQAKTSVWGATAVIVGVGPIGLMTLMAFKAAGGGKVICVDHIEKRLQTAKALGADVVTKPGDPSLVGAAEIVFECAGDTEATEGLMEKVQHGGSVVQVGWPQDVRVSVDISALLDLELNYSGLYRYANCYETAVTWLADGRIKSEGVITHRFPFEEADKAFEWAATNKETSVKTVVLN